jgi:hypothetical protein
MVAVFRVDMHIPVEIYTLQVLLKLIHHDPLTGSSTVTGKFIVYSPLIPSSRDFALHAPPEQLFLYYIMLLELLRRKVQFR